MILRNHGLMAVGKTVLECFLRLYRLERACQVQLDAAAAGTLHLVSPRVADRSAADLDGYQVNATQRGGRGRVRGADAEA